jgi:cephalosporin-C deacetylase-like acetyl esterase
VRAGGTQTGKYLFPVSQFGGNLPRAVHASKAVSTFGAYDMAGNVREWCANPYGEQRYILGGAWTDQTYMFNFANVLSPFDRSAVNGFRTVKYIDPSRLPADATGPIEFVVRDYSRETPVGDPIFQVYRQQFAYDHTDLNAKVESSTTDNEHWSQEKVTFRAAYGDERVIAFVTTPKSAKPPYQVVIHFPGSNAISTARLQDVPAAQDFIVRSGRVLVTPIVDGAYERNDGLLSTWPSTTHQYSEYVTKWVKDIRRTIDYLEGRGDIDMTRLAYLGTSWGGRMGAIIPAVEDRLRVGVIVLGGLAAGRARPEVDQINFISRVKIPILMLNGKYDSLEPVSSAQLPMFRMWGTPEQQKRHVIYESNGHSVPRNEAITETLDWLDKYLGPVK